MRAGRFGDRPVGAVTLVETPVSRSYARKARIAFYVVTAVVGGLAAIVLSTRLPLLAAVVVGVLLGAVAGFVVAVVVRAWPVLRALWHWSVEIAAAVAVVATADWLASVTHPLIVLAVLAAPVAVVGLVPPMGRRVVAMARCVVVRHRLRLCFAEFIRAANRVHPGSLPLILIARPTPAGQRVWVWLRPGLDLADLEGKTGRMAVACWADEVRVVRASARYAALIRVDVACRDPLAADVAADPLLRLVPAPDDRDDEQPMAVLHPASGLDLPDVPEPVVDLRSARR